MKQVLISGDTAVLRFNLGEEIISGLEDFAARQNIAAATVSGTGSASEVELGYYDINAKEYKKKTFSEKMETVGLLGNIALLDGKPSAHIHGTFANKDYQLIGGHVHRLVVNATMETAVNRLAGAIKRERDPEIGLNLIG
ncbi:MAG: DUF296 domain-containing protein [Patescibacteria group bacterium]|nr:DUF296 domain-containing protein [Patescibacteria group bacterium]